MAVQTTYGLNPAIGTPGMLADGAPNDTITMINKEASAAMTFGRAVKFEGSTDDKGALLPAAETDKIAGILIRSLAYAPSELDTTGTITAVKPNAVLNVLRRGRVYAVCEDGCVPGDRLWVRAVAGGDPEFLGGLNSADDGTDMVDCTAQGSWLTTAVAGGIAVLEVDFTNK